MAFSPEQESSLRALAGHALVRYVRLVHGTSRVTVEPPDARERLVANEPFILAMWHGECLLVPMMVPILRWVGKVSAIIARSENAATWSVVLRAFGVTPIMRSGNGAAQNDRGGASALRAAVRALKDGCSFGMTADMRSGKARQAGRGIVVLSRLSGRPIIPCAVASSRFVTLDTWGHMTINLPYSRLWYVLGDPIWVPPDANAETIDCFRLKVEEGLNRVTAQACRSAAAEARRAAARRPPDPAAPAGPLGVGLKAYRIGTSLLRSAAPPLLRIRERQGKEDPRRRGERYGEASAGRPRGPLMWLHAASVGETNAILPLIEGLARRRGDLTFLLTTGTVTSARLAAQRLGARTIHQYVPLDVAEYARSFLEHWQPDVAVFTESEIWPNLILEAAGRRIPLALINGRMSQRSFVRWRRCSGAAYQLFSRFDVVLAQNDKMTRGFSDLGARKVLTAGNLKTDAPPPPVDARELERLRAALEGRPVFVAASTHEGEEEVIAEAHRLLARQIQGICTVIAPRHPERGTALAELLKGRGFAVALRSLGQLPSGRTDLYIADTIGELGTLYALTPLAFVGGSLVDRGGQNPIEPIGHGAAVLTGPHWSNFRDVYRALLHHKGAEEVSNAEELAAAALKLITNDAELQRMRVGAKTALSSLSGALERTEAALEALLPPAPEGVRRAS